MWLHIRTLQCDQDWNHNLISLRALGRHRLPASCLGAPPCTLTCTDLIKLQLQTEERMGDAFKNSRRLSSPYPTCSLPLPIQPQQGIPTRCSAKGDTAWEGNEAKASPDLWWQSFWSPKSRSKVLLLFQSPARRKGSIKCQDRELCDKTFSQLHRDLPSPRGCEKVVRGLRIPQGWPRSHKMTFTLL